MYVQVCITAALAVNTLIKSDYPIPKPCQKDVNDKNERHSTGFEGYLQQNLYPMLKERILQAVQEWDEPLEERIRDKIVGTAYTCTVDLFNHYKDEEFITLLPANAENLGTGPRIPDVVTQPTSGRLVEENDPARDTPDFLLLPGNHLSYPDSLAVDELFGVGPIDFGNLNNAVSPAAASAFLEPTNELLNINQPYDAYIGIDNSYLPAPGS